MVDVEVHKPWKYKWISETKNIGKYASFCMQRNNVIFIGTISWEIWIPIQTKPAWIRIQEADYTTNILQANLNS